MKNEEIVITKANGKQEAFDIEKLERSLRRAHVTPANMEKITHHILQELEDGMTTHDIYKHAFSLLHKIENRSALHYSLRKAVMELGPSGFPFEQLVAGVFKAKGYDVITDQIVKGNCAEHEVDVVAWKQDSLIMNEVKFHGQPGLKSDLKIVLYVKARFEDLEKVTHTYGDAPQNLSEGWLVTNTKFSITAIKYAECQGLKVVGWNYPLDGNLHDLIDEHQLFPITCLHRLSDHDKKLCLDKNIVLCKALLDDETLLPSIGLSEANADAVKDEIKLLLSLA